DRDAVNFYMMDAFYVEGIKRQADYMFKTVARKLVSVRFERRTVPAYICQSRSNHQAAFQLLFQLDCNELNQFQIICMMQQIAVKINLGKRNNCRIDKFNFIF